MFTAVTAHPVLGDFRQFRMATASVQDANQVFHLLLAKGSASAMPMLHQRGKKITLNDAFMMCLMMLYDDALRCLMMPKCCLRLGCGTTHPTIFVPTEKAMSPSFTGGASPTVPSFFSIRRNTPKNLVQSAAEPHSWSPKKSKQVRSNKCLPVPPASFCGFGVPLSFLRRPLLTFHQDLATGLAVAGGIGGANMVFLAGC